MSLRRGLGPARLKPLAPEPHPPTQHPTPHSPTHHPQALTIDASKPAPGTRTKLLYRRGVALLGLQDYPAAVEDLREAAADGDPLSVAKYKEALALAKKQTSAAKKMWAGAFSKNSEEGDAEPTTPTAGGARAGASPARPAGVAASPARAGAASSAAAAASPGGGLSMNAEALAAAAAAAAAGSSPGSSASRMSVKALRARNGVEGDAEAAEVRKGLGSGSGDGTLEHEMEGQEEETSAGWGTYLVYGGIAAGALALGAYALSRRK